MKTRLPFIFIIITLMLDSIGIGLIIPVLPQLVQDLTGGSISEAAIWGGLLTTVYALMQFLLSPTIGNLSDRFGRRPILLWTLLAMGLDYILLSVAGTIWLLFLGRLIAGITGASFSTASAYVADISAPEKRAANFGLVGAAFGMGFVFGPALGGLLGELGPRAPFIAAAVVALSNAAIGYFILPETLKPEKRRPFQWRRANPLGALLAIKRLPGMLGLTVLMLVFTISHQVYPVIWPYFMIERFQLSPGYIGLTLASFGICMAIIQGGLIRVIVPRLGEMMTAKVGLVLNLAVFILTAFVAEFWMLMALIPFMALGVIVGPALQALMSNAVSDDAQGELQGLFASINGISMIISPLFVTAIFRWFTDTEKGIYLPGAPFLLSAVLDVAALVLLIIAIRKMKERLVA